MTFLESGNQTMSSIVSAMDTAMHQVRVLSERKDLFPQLPGVLGGVSLGLSAFFDDCWDFKKTLSSDHLSFQGCLAAND